VNREVVYMERPLEPNMGPLADVLLCTFQSTYAGSSLGNFCPESNSSSPTAFSHKRNPASSGQHRVENKMKIIVMYHILKNM
jgi:hypothetical protein